MVVVTPWLSVRFSSYSALNIQSTEMPLRWMRPNRRKNPQEREPNPKSPTLSVGMERRLSTERHSIRMTGHPCASQTMRMWSLLPPGMVVIGFTLKFENWVMKIPESNTLLSLSLSLSYIHLVSYEYFIIRHFISTRYQSHFL